MRALAILLGMLIVSIMSCVGQQANESNGPAIATEDVMYYANGDTLVGYFAFDSSTNEPRPGVLVVHEWWGHNPYARKRAEMLAELGYTALALDMYGNGKQADHPDDAQAFAMAVFQDFDRAKARFNAALDRLKQHPSVDVSKIAAIGYCFGGGIVLNMALQGADLRGVVSFHGSLPGAAPESAEGLPAMLVCNGADDPFVTAEQVEAFKTGMDEAGIDYTFKNYEGAVHSFTNPDANAKGEAFDMPLAYNQAADEQSWAEMQAFFDRVLVD